jgi:hypothetical protein
MANDSLKSLKKLTNRKKSSILLLLLLIIFYHFQILCYLTVILELAEMISSYFSMICSFQLHCLNPFYPFLLMTVRSTIYNFPPQI